MGFNWSELYHSVRRIWTFSPECVGRQSSKIATRKCRVSRCEEGKALWENWEGNCICSFNTLFHSNYKVVSSAGNYSAIPSKLREEGITFEPDNGFELFPITTIEVDDEAMELNKEFMSKLLDLDDVDAVYTDQK